MITLARTEVIVHLMQSQQVLIFDKDLLIPYKMFSTVEFIKVSKADDAG